MPEDTIPNEDPYKDKNPLPAIVAVVFLIAAVYGAFAQGQDPVSTPKIDDREVYTLPEPESLPLITEIPTLYESDEVRGRGFVSGKVGDSGLWLSDERHSRQVFGILATKWRTVRLTPGQSVLLIGKVYRSEGLQPISLEELDGDVISVLEQVETFIFIEHLQLVRDPAPSPTSGG